MSAEAVSGNFRIRRIVESDRYEGTTVTMMSTETPPPALEVGRVYALTFTPTPDANQDAGQDQGT